MAKKFDTLLEPEDIASHKQGDRQFVTALARGLEVLRAFKPEDGPLGNQELAERTGLPKPTVSRITHTLTTLGYLEYIARQARYAIAPAVLALGHQCVTTAGIKRVARPHMQELAEYADATVALGARDRLQMIYLDVARGSRTVAFSLDAGAHVPMRNSAMGAAFLRALPEQERNFLLDAIAKSPADEWPAIRRRLKAAFKALDATGFCVLEGTYERAINGVGCALTLPDGAVYAFSCSAPVFQFSRARLVEDIGPRLVAMCAAIRADLVKGL